MDYVIVGETRNYNYDLISKAAELVRRGAKLIGSNKDVRDRVLFYYHLEYMCMHMFIIIL